MDNGSFEIVKWFSGIVGTSVTVIIWFGTRRKKEKERIEEKFRLLDEKIVAMDKKTAEETATSRENILRLREKVDSERLDFKDRLKEITEYLYNRPR